MGTITLSVPDEVEHKLKPYEDRLPEILELGVSALQRRLASDSDEVERMLKILEASGRVILPRPASEDERRRDISPVHIDGRPVSEIVIEQRG